MDAMQTDGDHMRAPVRRRAARTVARRDAAPIERDGHVHLGARLIARHRCGQMESDLQRLLDAAVLEQLIAAMELVRGAVGQTRVQPDVVLAVRKRPVGDAQLQLLRHGRIDLFDQLERDERGDAFRRQLGERGDGR